VWESWSWLPLIIVESPPGRRASNKRITRAFITKHVASQKNPPVDPDSSVPLISLHARCVRPQAESALMSLTHSEACLSGTVQDPPPSLGCLLGSERSWLMSLVAASRCPNSHRGQVAVTGFT